MRSIKVCGILLQYPAQEAETAQWIEQAIPGALGQISDLWALEAPCDCRVVVMTSWLDFILGSAPWSWRILLAATVPLWIWRVRRAWSYSAGWTQRYGRRVAIGIKPARLIEISDRRAGRRMFVEIQDPVEKIRHVLCHELTHACSAHLRLPMWLNEGLAAVTVDRFMGAETIRRDTLDLLRDRRAGQPPPNYRQLARMGVEELVYHAVRGYWLVRFVEECHPALLRAMLGAVTDPRRWERELAAVLGFSPATFWKEIDSSIVAHFESA